MHEAKVQSGSSDYAPVTTDNAAPHRAKWNPLGWPKWAKFVGVLLIIGIIIGIIVGAVVGSRKNRYPNYSHLTYVIEDRFEGEAFFDNFDYFDDVDPAGGFVTYASQFCVKVYG